MCDPLEELRRKQARWDSVIVARQKWVAERRKDRSESREKSIPDIKEFYAGRNVLITGGTGFLGKVLIEKLLRSVPDLNKIYVIIRPKKNQKPAERMAAIFKIDLFDLIRRDRPEVLNKVVAIAGDVSCKGLNLSMDDKSLLEKEISVVFHAAATVRFDDPLKSAILLNTRGTQQMIELSKRMPNLKSFVYVSTTYCNTDQPVTMEKVYPTPFEWRNMIHIAETTSNSDLLALSKIFTGFQPNTYTFTKQLSEKVVDDARHQAPVIIVRPAVVVSTTTEPFIGWSDNLYGPVGFCMGIVKGLLRAFYIDPQVNLNTVPVDSVAKVLIAAAWLRGTNQQISEDSTATDVLNLSGEDICDPTYEDMFATLPTLIPILKPTSLRAPRIYKTTSLLYYYYKLYTSHLLFAMAADTILKLFGQQPRLMKVARVIHNVNMSLRYFLFNNFYNSTDALWKSITYITDPEFQHDMRFNFLEASITTCRYVYKNVLKDKEAGPHHQKIVEAVHYLQQLIKYALFFWVGWKLLLQHLVHQYLPFRSSIF